MDVDFLGKTFVQLLGGVPLLLQLAAFSIAAGAVLAVVLALMRLSGNAALDAIARSYVFVFRGTPLLVQIFLIYYGLGQFPEIRQSVLWPFLRQPYWCALLALTLNTAAYSSEIIRSGILSVPFGQIEAARACGMSRALVFRRIIVPQGLRVALPAYGNEIILVIKSSSLASTITLLDITGVARTLVAHTYAPYEVFLVAGALYLLLVLATTRLLALAERWLRTDAAAAPTPKPLAEPIG